MAGTKPADTGDNTMKRHKCDCNCHQGNSTDTDSDGSSEYENINVAECKRDLKMKMLPRKIILDIGGQKFATTPETIQRYSNTRLGRLTRSDPSYDQHSGEFFFDRSPYLFSQILDLYRCGELHIPHNICGPAIRKELKFWEISESKIAPCCWKTYKEYEEETKTVKVLDSMFGGQQAPEVSNARSRKHGIRKWMNDVWTFLEFPTTSLAAKIWAYVYLAFLILSIVVICLETHPDFRVPGNARMKSCKLQNTPPNMTNQTSQFLMDRTNPKAQMYLTTEPHLSIIWLDHICTFLFMSELTMRFIVWPNKLRFFTSFFNVIDILAVVPNFMMRLITMISECFWIERSFLPSYLIMSFVCVFRAVRILKLVKHSRGLQIMYLAIKASLREIMLLLLLVIIGTLIFSTMIYYAEFSSEDNFMNIPIGFWWSIVTMTTVGYGDIVPKTALGYLVGSACALSGMLITGLPIPVIANSFHLYYSYAKLKDKLEFQRQASNIREMNNSWSRSTGVDQHHQKGQINFDHSAWFGKKNKGKNCSEKRYHMLNNNGIESLNPFQSQIN